MAPVSTSLPLTPSALPELADEPPEPAPPSRARPHARKKKPPVDLTNPYR
jgi:hypothetical protein